MGLADFKNIAQGQPVAICGKGPSIARVQWEHMTPWRLCLNHAVMVVPNPTACVMRDAHNGRLGVEVPDCVPVFIPDIASDDWKSHPLAVVCDIMRLDQIKPGDTRGLYHGYNCAHPAIHLAYIMGASELILIGMDSFGMPKHPGNFYPPCLQSVSRPVSSDIWERVNEVHTLKTVPLLGRIGLPYRWWHLEEH